MAQSEACDPRTEALAVSRHRTGSIKMENNENQPPASPVSGKNTSQFVNLRIRFEDSATGNGGHGAKTGGPLLGSSVSKIKERFQKNERTVGDAAHGSLSSNNISQVPRSKEGGDRSPETKKMKVEGQGRSSAASIDSKLKTSSSEHTSSSYNQYNIRTPPLSPTHASTATSSSLPGGISSSPRRRKTEGAVVSKSQEPNVDSQVATSEPSLLEATNHVQRFNYTRALFARMEEETRRAQEREKIIRRKPSPSRPFPGNAAPQLSPVPVSLNFETKRTTSTRDQIRDQRRPKSMSDFPSGQSSAASESFKRLSDSPSSVDILRDDRKRNQNGNAAPPSAVHRQNEKADDSSKSDQILRSRRPHRTPFKRDDSGDRSGKYFQNVDALKALQDGNKGRASDALKHTTANKTSNQVDGSDKSDRSSSSDVSSSPPPALPHSSRLGHSVRPAYRARAQAAASGLSSSTHSKTSDVQDSIRASSVPSSSFSSSVSSSSVVLRRQNKSASDSVNGDEEAKKRASKEDIDTALERADTYLAHMRSPDDGKVDTIKQEHESKRTQSHTESARRQFLYGTDSSAPVTNSHDDSRKTERDQEVSNLNKTPSSAPILSSSASISSSVPPSPVKSSASVILKSPTSSCESLDIEAHLPPPSYHEVTDPPPYHEATSPTSMLISQKVILSQQQRTIQTSATTSSGGQPVPVPRRVAPPPPLPKKPATGNDSGVPPPAPEPGPSEYIHDPEPTTGVGNAVVLDGDIGDDLILPEEHIARHHDLGLQNGDLDSTSFSRTGFLITRESGDGKEDAADADVLSDGEPLEIDYSNLTFIEIAPISSEEEDESSGDEIVGFHKPSRVCFSKNPIRVFATYSTNDYDRRNEDVDPVAASAEYELEKRVEKMDVFPVMLQKGSEGLGFSIIGMGVGADAGLEKLGIFIKTLTPNGVAQRSNQIEVNDQIIEVDGKSLVGVTQAYAASVLRNTSGEVNFLIGREKDPSKSEVARLIQQSLEQDRRREEMREKEQQKLRHLEDSFQPKDEVLERHAHSHLFQHSRHDDSASDAGDDDKDIEESNRLHPERRLSLSEHDRIQLEQETAAGDTTPQSAPSNGEDAVDSSPEISEVHPTTEAAITLEGIDDVLGSSSDSTSPDLENDKLLAKLKEAQYKLTLAEAEKTKLKAKLLVLESSEEQKKVMEKKMEDLTRKCQEREKHFDALKKELAQYKDMMVASQSQHIELEKKVKELGALEKKYHKAKKLIKEYQLREKDFIQERESLLEQQAEKDQQYNSLVKSLKDRIFMLEKDISDVRKAAGLPPSMTAREDIELPGSPSRPIPLVRSTPHTVLEEPLSPLNQSTEDVLDTSTCSEISDPATSPVLEESLTMEKTLAVSSSHLTVDLGSSELSFPVMEEPFKTEFDSFLNSPPLLDSSANRDKAHAAVSGSHASRRPPAKKTKNEDSLEELDSSNELTENSSIHSSMTDHAESGLDMWNKHDRQEDSDTSSSVSQTSYDPSRPSFKAGSSEIPDMAADDTSTNSEGGVTLISAKASASAKGFAIPKFNWKPSPKGRGGDSGGSVILLANRPLAHQHSASDPGLDSAGVTLVSRKYLDTDYDASSVNSDITSSLMVGEPDGDSSGKYVLHISSTPVHEDHKLAGPITDWSTDGVCQWLTALDMDKYTTSFRDKGITGSQLLHLDSSKLKSMGIVSSKDRELLKKKIKEMKLNAEREKKMQEKERKQKEKEQKKMSKKK